MEGIIIISCIRAVRRKLNDVFYINIVLLQTDGGQIYLLRCIHIL